MKILRIRLFALALMLLKAVSPGQIIYRAYNNEVMQGFYRPTECQTDEIVYRHCSNLTDGGDFLMLHILVPGNESVTVSVTDADGRALDFQHCIYHQQQQQLQVGTPFPTMNFNVLHVKIAGKQNRWLDSAPVTRVETRTSVRHYSLLSKKTRIASNGVRNHTMIAGYILETSAPSNETVSVRHCGRTDKVVRLVAMVSRAMFKFGRSTKIEVQNMKNNGHIIFMNKQTKCFGDWCFYDVKKATDCKTWHIVTTSPIILFKFDKKMMLSVVEFAQLTENKSNLHSSSTEYNMPDERVTNATCNFIQHHHHPGLQFASTTNFITILVSVLVILGLIFGLFYLAIRRCRRRSAYSTASSKVLIVCSANHPLSQLRSQSRMAVQRLEHRGYSVNFLHSLSINQLRVSLAETRVFILLGEDSRQTEAHEADRRDKLELLTTAEKSRYTIVRGRNQVEQLTNYLHDLVTQRGEHMTIA